MYAIEYDSEAVEAALRAVHARRLAGVPRAVHGLMRAGKASRHQGIKASRGDAGAPRGGAGAEPGGHSESRANARVVMTGAPLDATVPTRDRSDRAHLVRDEEGNLRPARSLKPSESVPRRYPACYMTSAGVSFETSYDDLAVRQRALAGIPGVGVEGPLEGRRSLVAERTAEAIGKVGAWEFEKRGRSVYELPGHDAAARWLRENGGGVG